MKQYTSKCIHVPRLLTLGDLDVRKMAAENETLTADAYFARVEAFIEQWPEYAAAFARGQAGTLRALGDALTGIGYDRVSAALDALCRALAPEAPETPETPETPTQVVTQAAEIRRRLETLHDRLKSAYRKKRFAAGPDRTQEEEVLLSEALAYFDYEEAHRKLRILAVDDIAVVLSTITSLLSPHYEVFALTKASQVEKFLETTTPELFLLDVEMPELRGYDLLSVIRRFEAHKDTPVIFLTGNATLENLKTAVSLGACDFMTKPINRDILLEKIETHIVRKKAF